MHSGEGEVVPFSEKLYPTGNVEDWLCEVERVMKGSLREILRQSLEAYDEVKDELSVIDLYISFRISLSDIL